jgi:hypothetical protein
VAPRISPADFFRSRPPGARHWLDTFGSSMSPFLQSGDGLFVERDAATNLSPGDIAILARRDGALIAHLVTRATPLRTTSMLGSEDPSDLEPLGRAVRVRAHGVEVPVNAALRRSLLASHSVLKVGRAREAVHRVLSAPGVRSVRRALLEPEVHTLKPSDEPRALLALGDLGATFGPDVLRVAFGRGVVAGAIARGRIVALAALVPSTVPHLAQLSLTGVRASARNLGLENRLVALCVVEARARGMVRLEAAAVAPDSVHALAAAGFDLEEEGRPLTLTLAPLHQTR